MASQVILLYVSVNKYLIKLPMTHVKPFLSQYLQHVDTNFPEVRIGINKSGDLSDSSISSLKKAAESFLKTYCQQNAIKLEDEEDA
jgi:F0F1-type ATP synthase alpha subunit